MPVERLDFFLLVHPSSFHKRQKSPLKIYAFLEPLQLFPSFLHIQLLVFSIFLSKTFQLCRPCSHQIMYALEQSHWHFLLLFFLKEYLLITNWLLVYCKLGRFILIDGFTSYSFPNLAPLFSPFLKFQGSNRYISCTNTSLCSLVHSKSFLALQIQIYFYEIRQRYFIFLHLTLISSTVESLKTMCELKAPSWIHGWSVTFM